MTKHNPQLCRDCGRPITRDPDGTVHHAVNPASGCPAVPDELDRPEDPQHPLFVSFHRAAEWVRARL